jgi:hypothetical protein
MQTSRLAMASCRRALIAGGTRHESIQHDLIVGRGLNCALLAPELIRFLSHLEF